MNDSLVDKPATDRVELKGILSEFREALENEIEKIKTNGQTSTLLYSGHPILSRGKDFWYQFGVDYAPNLPADTPCKLLIGKDQFDVTVISFDESSITVSSNVQLPESIAKARLENGATVLMERLIQCIEDNATTENCVGEKMIASTDHAYSAKQIFSYADLTPKAGNTCNQNKAIESALSNDITYIWGPPGTGKTTVIGQIIYELYRHGRTVLVVSHTNTAIDGAIEKTDKVCYETYGNEENTYPILRIGVPTRPLPDRVLLSHHVAILGKDLDRKKRKIEQQESQVRRRLEKTQHLVDKKNWLEKSGLAEIHDIIQEIQNLDNAIINGRQEVEILDDAVYKIQTSNSDWDNCALLKQQINSKSSEHIANCDEINKYQNRIKVLPTYIQHAVDEAKKHLVYANLKKQEENYMSVSFIQARTEETDEAIRALEEEIESLEERKKVAQKTISDYNNKGSVARFFAGRSTVSLAHASIEAVENRLPEAKHQLQQMFSLKQKYTNQLNELNILQEQIRAVRPTKTREHWNAQAVRLDKELLDIKGTLSDLQTVNSRLYSDLCILRKRLEKATAVASEIEKLNEQRTRINTLLDKNNDECKLCRSKCTSIIQKEAFLCSKFGYTFSEKTPQHIYEELVSLKERVGNELSSIDFVRLNSERKDDNNLLIDIIDQLEEINQQIQELETVAIGSAKIVGTTLTKSYLSESLRKRKFDTVILDEASMASIPALWCAAYLAQTNVVIVGDFLQLSPIVLANTEMAKKWLGTDIFSHSGMQTYAEDPKNCPNNFVMLNEQFRMESEIADIANMYYGRYGGLISNDLSPFREKDRSEFYSWYQGPYKEQTINLIDTENLHAWVTGVPQGKGHSRLNCFSAAVDVDLAFSLLSGILDNLDPRQAKPVENAKILIVAPYKPHVARIRQLVDIEYRHRGFIENLNYIRVGTVHSFQGSEADIVIFDLVVDEPHWKANLFLSDENVNEEMRKMFNVAVTRARFKLFIVGNFAYCLKRSKNNALAELLDHVINKKHLERIDAKELLPNITFSRPSTFNYCGTEDSIQLVCREDSFNSFFMRDIHTFKERLIIYSPFITESRLSILLPAFSDAINAGKQIIVVTKALSDRGKSEIESYRKCENELRTTGVKILHKKGMHEKLIFIDDETVWVGSLNALSFTGLTGEVMQRHFDKDLSTEYQKLFDIEHLCDAIHNPCEQSCPICGGEMIIKESADGGVYWQCVNEDYSRNVTQQYPTDGLYRCKCGAPYMFVMKKEPRWVCTQDSRHYQKIRESDLRLEKMAALIPTKTARKAVDRYFAQKRNPK